ncbi:hypothetical protein Fmac_030889 [Flemingia macrophylla]|uniref:Uncharacterized protein n=1 Tax=Flemingia macrophylla TaxID=520843 RepID=A0ABD1L0W8_9FABA
MVGCITFVLKLLLVKYRCGGEIYSPFVELLAEKIGLIGPSSGGLELDPELDAGGDNWLGEVPLCKMFPRLYRNSEHKVLSISEMGSWDEGSRWGDNGLFGNYNK